MAPLLYALLRGRGGEGELFDSEGRSLRPFTVWQGFLIGWASGIVWYLGTCYWIYPVMHVYGGLPGIAATLITIAFCIYMGLHHGAFAALVVMMARRSTTGNRRPLLLAPVFWTAIELFRDRVIGDPWNPLGGAQIDNIPFARMAQVAGVYGLSFAVMLVNCALVAAMLAARAAPQEPAGFNSGGSDRPADRGFCQTGPVYADAPGRADAGKCSACWTRRNGPRNTLTKQFPNW